MQWKLYSIWEYIIANDTDQLHLNFALYKKIKSVCNIDK